MKLSGLLLAGMFLLGIGGCGPKKPQEPVGTTVELTAEDQRRAHIAYDDMEAWYAWHTKGIRLMSPRDGNRPEEHYQEALYCFHQAQAAWPKKLPDSASEDRKKKHSPEPTDTLIQKGWLYLKIDQPELALYYFKRFNSYMPYSPVGQDGLAQAEAAVKARKQ